MDAQEAQGREPQGGESEARTENRRMRRAGHCRGGTSNIIIFSVISSFPGYVQSGAPCLHERSNGGGIRERHPRFFALSFFALRFPSRLYALSFLALFPRPSAPCLVFPLGPSSLFAARFVLPASARSFLLPIRGLRSGGNRPGYDRVLRV